MVQLGSINTRQHKKLDFYGIVNAKKAALRQKRTTMIFQQILNLQLVLDISKFAKFGLVLN